MDIAILGQTGGNLLQSLFNGLVNGAIYGMVAIGLVLVYKGARVFNFAQGEFGTSAVFVAWLAHARWDIPMPFALLMGLATAVLMGLLVELLVVRPLSNSPKVILLVATAGIAVAAIGVQFVLGEADLRSLDPLVKVTDPIRDAIFVFKVPLYPQDLIMIAMLGVLAVALYLFFSRTNLGLAVLATSQDDLATRLSGISTKRISSFVWGTAALLGGLAGLLQAPAAGLFYPGFMTTTVLLPSFAGAVLGGMTSLPGAFVGGLLIGVAQDLGDFLLPETIPGATAVTVFVMLLAVLLIRPQGLLGKEA